MVGPLLLEQRVLAAEDDAALALRAGRLQPHRELHERRVARVDAVLERILDQRDEEQRRDFGGLGRDGEVLFDRRLAVAAHRHQVHVVVHERHLRRKRDLRRLAVVQRIAQQVAQLADALLGLVRVDLGQGGDVVQRVEEEMGAQLVLQPDEFGLGGLAPLPLEGDAHLLVPADVADAEGEQDDDDLPGDGHQDRDEVEGPEAVDAEGVQHLLGDFAAPEEEAEVQCENQQRVHAVEPFLPPAARIQQLRNQQVIVQEIDQDQRQKQLKGHFQDGERLRERADDAQADQRRHDAEGRPRQPLRHVYDDVLFHSGQR